jgi:TolB-like protein
VNARNAQGASGRPGLLAELRRRNVIRMAGLYLITAWLLVQIAETLLPIFDTPGWVLKALVVLVALGFIPALVFSWVFELTPEGLKRDAEVTPAQSIAPQTAKRMDRLILLGLAAVVVVVAADRFWPRSEPVTPASTVASAASDAASAALNAASIAVLPFADLSPAGDQGYFSDGMAEEILNALVKVEGLQVASRTSSFGFKGQEALGVPAIAGKLEVRHILEGSVRRAGDTLRITAQLIDAETDRHLWSETFDRPLTAENVFAIQDDIARAIVAALVDSLDLKDVGSVAPAKPTANLTVYDLYLQARAMFQARRDFAEADRLLAEALAQDPAFAKAWELRAAVQMMMDEYGGSELDAAEIYRIATGYAEKALALDPRSALALASIANMSGLASRNLDQPADWATIIADLERAIEIDPHNSNAMNWLGIAFGLVGENERALAMFQRCSVVDPALAPCRENEVDVLWALGRPEQARARFADNLSRGLVTENYTNFAVLAHFEERTTFLFALNQPLWLPGWQRGDEVYDAFRNPDTDHPALLGDLRNFLSERTSKKTYLGSILIPLGGYELRPLPLVMWGPEFARYRKSEEFKRLIEQGGVLAYWQAHGFPPQCRAAGAGGFECD